MDVMNGLANYRYLRIVGFPRGPVAVSGAAVLITASAAGVNVGFRPAASPPAPATTASIANKANATALCNSFISHLSSDLGKTPAQVNAAVQKAIGETLADEVKNKDLTQAQADAIKKKLTSQPPCSLGGFNKVPDAGASARIGAYTQQLLSAAASALGVTDA